MYRHNADVSSQTRPHWTGFIEKCARIFNHRNPMLAKRMKRGEHTR
jgi:hypothetical protein